MEMLSRIQTPALVLLLLLIFSVGVIYFASQLPEYFPYRLDEQFTSLDLSVWDIGGMRNYSVSNGMLTLFDSTNATHYFITNPKWRSPIPDTRLQGRLEISFRANAAATNRSVAIAGTDSWRTYAYNGMLGLDLNATENEKTRHVEVALDPAWHSLVAESAEGSFNLSLDGQILVSADHWKGNITRVELGTGLQYLDGSGVQGVLSVNGVKADLRPLVNSGMFLPEKAAQNLAGVSEKHPRDILPELKLLGFRARYPSCLRVVRLRAWNLFPASATELAHRQR